MVISCIISDCPNKKTKSRSFSFHEFPSNLDRLEAWVREIKRRHPQFTLSENSHICSAHFEDNYFITDAANRRLLKKEALPTKFDRSSKTLITQSRKRKLVQVLPCKEDVISSCKNLCVDLAKNNVCIDRSSLCSRKSFRKRTLYTSTRNLTTVVFLPQSSEPSVPTEGTMVIADPPKKQFYYSDRQKAKIDSELAKIPDVSVYLADPIDLEVVPQQLDPEVVSYLESPVPIPRPYPEISSSQLKKSASRKGKILARRKLRGSYGHSLSRFRCDHDYQLPSGIELRERLEGATMMVEHLEKEVKNLEKAKRHLKKKFTEVSKEVNNLRKTVYIKRAENRKLIEDANQMLIKLNELTTMKSMSEKSIPIQMAQRLVKAKMMNSTHSYEKFSDEIRNFSESLYDISPQAFKFVREQMDNALPHPSIVRKWIIREKSEIFCKPDDPHAKVQRPKLKGIPKKTSSKESHKQKSRNKKSHHGEVTEDRVVLGYRPHFRGEDKKLEPSEIRETLIFTDIYDSQPVATTSDVCNTNENDEETGIYKTEIYLN